MFRFRQISSLIHSNHSYHHRLFHPSQSCNKRHQSKQSHKTEPRLINLQLIDPRSIDPFAVKKSRPKHKHVKRTAASLFVHVKNALMVIPQYRTLPDGTPDVLERPGISKQYRRPSTNTSLAPKRSIFDMKKRLRERKIAIFGKPKAPWPTMVQPDPPAKGETVLTPVIEAYYEYDQKVKKARAEFKQSRALGIPPPVSTDVQNQPPPGVTNRRVFKPHHKKRRHPDLNDPTIASRYPEYISSTGDRLFTPILGQKICELPNSAQLVDRWRRVVHRLTPLGNASAYNKCSIYYDGDIAFQNMWLAISDAKYTIRMATYILQADTVGKHTMCLLRDAALRGVDVTLMFDSAGSSDLIMYHAEWMESLSTAGVQCVQFNPIDEPGKWNRRLLFRDHRKILIVDSKVGFTGGMNIGSHYCGRAMGGSSHFRDTHIKIQGLAVRDLIKVFKDSMAEALPDEEFHQHPGTLEVRQRYRSIPDDPLLRKPTIVNPSPKRTMPVHGTIHSKLLGGLLRIPNEDEHIGQRLGRWELTVRNRFRPIFHWTPPIVASSLAWGNLRDRFLGRGVLKRTALAFKARMLALKGKMLAFRGRAQGRALAFKGRFLALKGRALALRARVQSMRIEFLDSRPSLARRALQGKQFTNRISIGARRLTERYLQRRRIIMRAGLTAVRSRIAAIKLKLADRMNAARVSRMAVMRSRMAAMRIRVAALRSSRMAAIRIRVAALRSSRMTAIQNRVSALRMRVKTMRLSRMIAIRSKISILRTRFNARFAEARTDMRDRVAVMRSKYKVNRTRRVVEPIAEKATDPIPKPFIRPRPPPPLPADMRHYSLANISTKYPPLSPSLSSTIWLHEPRAYDCFVQILMANAYSDKNHAPAVRHVSAMLMSDAQERIHITTPYFMPDSRLRKALIGAARRGVDISIITSGATSEVPWARWGAIHRYESCLREGVRIYEMNGHLHAKTMTIDGVYASVSSYNFDRMSLVNLEASVTAIDPDLAYEMEAQFYLDKQDSQEMTLEMVRQRSFKDRVFHMMCYHAAMRISPRASVLPVWIVRTLNTVMKMLGIENVPYGRKAIHYPPDLIKYRPRPQFTPPPIDGAEITEMRQARKARMLRLIVPHALRLLKLPDKKLLKTMRDELPKGFQQHLDAEQEVMMKQLNEIRKKEEDLRKL